MEHAIYLDNNATTRTDPEVVAAMLPFFSENFGNASSTHVFGKAVSEAVRDARRQVQILLGAAHDHEIVFTSGGTESDNTAILSALRADSARTEIVTTAVEHPAILSLVAYLEKSENVKVHTIGVDSCGRLDIDAYRNALGSRTAIASVMWANNETGTINPVAELAEMASEAGALFHTDAVQAVGKIPFDLQATKVDMLSLSGHKINGPKGIGALYIRKGIKLNSLIRGGRQERGRRAGTENVPGIIGLGKAAERAAAHLADEQGYVKSLRDRMEHAITRQIPECTVLGDRENRLPNTCNIAFDYIDSEPVLHMMEKAGIAASSGSACASGSMEPSHVLRAMNVPPTSLQGAVRFSLSRDNTEQDVDHVAHVLPDIVAKVRARSPLWAARCENTGARRIA